MTLSDSVLLLTVAAMAACTELVVRRRHPLRVILLGAGPFATLAAQQIEEQPYLGCRIIGLVEEEGVAIPAALARYPHLGAPADLGEIVERLRPHRILVALADKRGRLPAVDLLEHQLRGVVIEEASEVYERLSGKLAIETLHAGSQLFRNGFRASALQDRIGRTVSLLCGFFGLICLAPGMLVIALAIKLDSRGPVLFRQKRIGLGGQPFELLKFRTMRSAQGAGSEWVTDNRARITRVGGFLRRARLDELPQFVNLLRGEMNLVGPRPHPISNFTLFNEQIPFYSLRCLVRPGLTGWAQIKYQYANNLAEETEKMRYDLYYIKHRSAWLDLQIIPATLRAVLVGRGAQGHPAAAAPAMDLALRAVVLAIPAATMAIPAVALALPALGEKVLGQLDWIPGAGVNRWRGGALVSDRNLKAADR